MTRDEAVALVQEGLGFRTDLEARIIEKLKQAQMEEELRPKLPDFLLSEYTYRQVTSGEERVAWPTNYLRGAEDDALWYYNASAEDEEDVWTALEKGDVEYLRKAYPGTGAPEAYAEIGGYFRVFPTPDDTYQLRHLFYEKDEVLSTNVENRWLAHVPYLLIGVAGREIAKVLRDKEALQHFSDMEQKWRGLLFVSEEAREHSNQRYIMGDPD